MYDRCNLSSEPNVYETLTKGLRTESFQVNLKTGKGVYTCFGKMQSLAFGEIYDDDMDRQDRYGLIYERSVVYDKHLCRRRKATAKPQVLFTAGLDTFLLRKCVLIGKGDFIFFGRTDVVRETPFVQKIYRVADITNWGGVKLVEYTSWHYEDCLLEDYIDGLEPGFRKGVEKSLEVKQHREGWLRDTTKYIIKEV